MISVTFPLFHGFTRLPIGQTEIDTVLLLPVDYKQARKICVDQKIAVRSDDQKMISGRRNDDQSVLYNDVDVLFKMTIFIISRTLNKIMKTSLIVRMIFTFLALKVRTQWLEHLLLCPGIG